MKGSKQNNLQRLIQIRKAIDQIESFISGVSRDKFISNSLISSAVLYQFSVIGEAVVHIDKDLLNKYDYPWYQVRGFRNLISHEYFNVDFEAVWEIIVKDLPGLKKSVIDIILDQNQNDS